MEALEGLGIDWKLLVAQIINFLILLFLLRFFLYKPIVNILSQRKEKIAKGIKDAEEAAERLNKASKESREILTQASLESEKIIKSAKQDMEEQTQKQIEQTKLKAQQILKLSREQAAKEQEKIVVQAKREITDLAVTISEKVMEIKVDKNDVQKVSDKIR